jgi:hypothetical protein
LFLHGEDAGQCSLRRDAAGPRGNSNRSVRFHNRVRYLVATAVIIPRSFNSFNGVNSILRTGSIKQRQKQKLRKQKFTSRQKQKYEIWKTEIYSTFLISALVFSFSFGFVDHRGHGRTEMRKTESRNQPNQSKK